MIQQIYEIWLFITCGIKQKKKKGSYFFLSLFQSPLVWCTKKEWKVDFEDSMLAVLKSTRNQERLLRFFPPFKSYCNKPPTTLICRFLNPQNRATGTLKRFSCALPMNFYLSFFKMQTSIPCHFRDMPFPFYRHNEAAWRLFFKKANNSQNLLCMLS